MEVLLILMTECFGAPLISVPEMRASFASPQSWPWNLIVFSDHWTGVGVDAQEASSLAVVTQAANSAAGTRIQAAGAHISYTFLILRFLSISYICICFRWAEFFLLIWLWRGDTLVSFWFLPS